MSPNDHVKQGAEEGETVLPPSFGRMALEDPLLECLVMLAKDSGRRTSVAALSAGLPLSREGFASPALFVRAAGRVDMSARLVRRGLEHVTRSPGLPCILVLQGRQACVLRSFSEKDGAATLTFPETPEETVTLPLDALEKRYGGYAFFVRPRSRLDARAGPRALEPGKDWFWGQIRRHGRIYRQVAVAAVMINLFALATPIFTRNIYDRVLPNNAVETAWVLAVGVLAALVFDFLIKNLRTHFLDAAGRKSDIRISASVFEHIQGLKMSARPPSSGVLADNIREFESLRDFFTSATLVTLIDLPFVFLFLLLIWVMGGALVAVPLVSMAVIVVFGWFLQKPLEKVMEEHAREGAYKSSLLIETLGGLETIKIHAAEGHNQRKWEEIVEHSSQTSMRARGLTALGVSFTAFMGGVVSVGTLVHGAYLTAAGEITAGALIAALILCGRILSPLGQVASILSRLNQSRTALRRLDELMKLPVERDRNQAFVSRPALKGHIVFRDVTFRYPRQTSDTLNGISMEIKPGERVGVIGAVGSGKTTLERLIVNLYQPTQGSVEIDGLDVRQIEPGDLRRNIGVVQQDAYLFYGTLRDNIILGHESVHEDAILRAATLAGVTDFMQGSAAGLDTHVGERGEYLSGGQRQAVAVARALLYDPPILILDEPTAHIDPRSERVLRQRLEKICVGKTVILITHRSPLLAIVEKLALMDKGRIVDFGPRDAVLKNLQEKKYNPVAEGED